MLEALITSKTRLRILIKFFINAANNVYLCGLAEEMQESTNTIRKVLNNLEKTGYLKKKRFKTEFLIKKIPNLPYIKL